MKKEIQYKKLKTLLNKGTGYLSGYTHSLNPYTGCTFGCSYCYVRQMPVGLFRKQDWGTWVDVKIESQEILRKELRKAKSKGNVTIFMSSSTDPYQPIEYKAKVTRSLLEVMIENPPDFILVQTRSPLVQRDIDLFLQLKDKVRISMTVETDRETIRKMFTPFAPPIPARLKALKALKDEGIPAQVAIAPALPSSDTFPEQLKPLVERICIDDYFMGDGSGGRRTEKLGIQEIYEKNCLEEWFKPTAYLKLYDRFKEVFRDDQIYISQSGFEP